MACRRFHLRYGCAAMHSVAGTHGCRQVFWYRGSRGPRCIGRHRSGLHARYSRNFCFRPCLRYAFPPLLKGVCPPLPSNKPRRNTLTGPDTPRACQATGVAHA
eukprot:scaffold189165_cov28-Tisochrysis_lutea.AAC.3